jgi:cyclic pyranopterin phosphate synthase
MPGDGIPLCPRHEILTYEEIETVVRAAAEIGITKVRVTGGEPLVRADIVDLIRMVAGVPGIDDLAMTTNGILLSQYARASASAGLKRVNVSLDSLRPERFRRITRVGRLEYVLQGMKAAREAGLKPVKINTVVMRGTNDDEVLDFARKTMHEDWNVRFIELMPVGCGGSVDDRWRERVVTAQEVRDKVEAVLGQLEPAKVSMGDGPARYYRLPGAQGTLGFITPISDHFCYRCNRMRLTADGQLRPCLLSDQEIDLRTPLRQGARVEEIIALLLKGVESKPQRHHLPESDGPEKRAMSQIGG